MVLHAQLHRHNRLPGPLIPAVGGGGSALGAWDTTQSDILDSASAGWSGYTMRLLIAAAKLSNTGQNTMRLVVKPTDSVGMECAKMYINQQAGSGNAWDYIGTPTEITFGDGGSGFTASPGIVVISDPITFTIPNANIVIGMYFDGTTSLLRGTGDGDYDGYYDNSDVAADVAPSGLSSSGSLNINFGINLIQTQEV